MAPRARQGDRPLDPNPRRPAGLHVRDSSRHPESPAEHLAFLFGNEMAHLVEDAGLDRAKRRPFPGTTAAAGIMKPERSSGGMKERSGFSLRRTPWRRRGPCPTPGGLGFWTRASCRRQSVQVCGASGGVYKGGQRPEHRSPVRQAGTERDASPDAWLAAAPTGNAARDSLRFSIGSGGGGWARARRLRWNACRRLSRWFSWMVDDGGEAVGSDHLIVGVSQNACRKTDLWTINVCGAPAALAHCAVHRREMRNASGKACIRCDLAWFAGADAHRIPTRTHEKAGKVSLPGFLESFDRTGRSDQSSDGLHSSVASAARLKACSRPTISEDGLRLSKLALSFLRSASL